MTLLHLVRKQDLSRARGSGRRRASADGLWVTVSGGSGGGGLELAGVGVDGLDRDLVAEAFQAADVIAGLAAGVPALFVGVGAEGGVAGFGVGQQGVGCGGRGVAGGGPGLPLWRPPGRP